MTLLIVVQGSRRLINVEVVCAQTSYDVFRDDALL